MISPCLCASAKLEFLRGVHRPEDVFKIALYTNQANLNGLTTAYSREGEVRGQGYHPGGAELEGLVQELEGVTAVMTWRKAPVWANATITADGALIYNASRGNKAVAVIAFDRTVTSTNGNFRIPMPPATAAEALIFFG